ncbi:hypothetical protein B9G53_03615 [Pseudanabaena sp. SR411]|nr:hypothetical protein B9G53_03615 [Pseudanabaena sp. SR411]
MDEAKSSDCAIAYFHFYLISPSVSTQKRVAALRAATLFWALILSYHDWQNLYKKNGVAIFFSLKEHFMARQRRAIKCSFKLYWLI